MATTPTPRSFQSVLGGMVDAFRSRTGIGGLRVGGPLLSILEAAAQSDIRSTQDIFNLLDSISLDRAKGVALERIGRDEGVLRRGAIPASGYVTFFDTSFDKVETTIYTGTAAPVAGSHTIHIADASEFPRDGGSVYIGRGTNNYEGPIEYTSVENMGSYWVMHLAQPTLRFHNLTESVILAQGGDRRIPAGTVVQTPQGSAKNAAKYATVFEAVLLDGEDELRDVFVVCQKPGVIGNAAKGGIREVAGSPFAGAAVTNELPFSNGREAEDETSYRERIREAKQTKQKGTALAIKNAALDVESAVESKRVVSASIVTQKGKPTTLYIDDGTGYEEQTSGVAYERLVDYAIGGEYLFQLAQRPVAKAFVQSTVTGPWAITDGATLAVKVGDSIAFHSFSREDFNNLRTATAFEVVASINSNPALPYSARTAAAGTAIALFAKADTNESIQVVEYVGDADDANLFFGFPKTQVDTLKLYKNDTLLHKDGREAVLYSMPSKDWTIPTSVSAATTATISIDVDGTGTHTYTITAADFAGTGYTTVSKTNSPAAWATALNRKVPGIVASAVGTQVAIRSARGAVNEASLRISGGSLMGGMFSPEYGLTAQGRKSDYSFDRNTSQIALVEPLAPGDVLTVGTEVGGAYLESQPLQDGSVTFNDEAKLFFVLDSELTTTDLFDANLGSYTVSVISMGDGRYRFQSNAPANSNNTRFDDLSAGDWAIVWDDAIAAKGAWRVIDKDVNYFDVFPTAAIPTSAAVATRSSGITFLLGKPRVVTVTIAPGTYSLDALAEQLNAADALPGGYFSVWNGETLLVHTNTVGSNGNITLIAANTEGQRLGFPMRTTVRSDAPHTAFVESGNSEVGTPSFYVGTPSAMHATRFTLPANGERTFNIDGGHLMKFMGGANKNAALPFADAVTYELRRPLGGVMTGDKAYGVSSYAIGAEDELNVTLDTSYVVPFYRRIQPTSTIYGRTINVTDVDADGALEVAFGADFDFSDFAVFMRARGVSHAGTNRGILWRYGRFGKEGNFARVSYELPLAPSKNFELKFDSKDGYANVRLHLPSTGPKNIAVQDTARFFLDSVGRTNHSEVTMTYAKLTITQLARDANGTVTANVTSAAPLTSMLRKDDMVWVDPLHAAFPGGPKVVTQVGSGFFRYVEPGTETTASGTNGTLRFSAVVPDFSTLAVGDVVSFKDTEWGSGAYRIRARTATSITFDVPNGDDGIETLDGVPMKVNAGSNVKFYSIDTTKTKASDIVAWVNANTQEVSATATGDGSGVINTASFNEWILGLATAGHVQLVDGINWVKSLNPTTGELTFKQNVSAALTGWVDLQNEEMRLVPQTAATISRFLNSKAVSGLYLAAKTSPSTSAKSVLLASVASGGEGRVQVAGGTANAATAAVVGSGKAIGNYASVMVPVEQTKGLHGGMWVAVQGVTPQSKPPFFDDPLASYGMSVVDLGGGRASLQFELGLWTQKYKLPSSTNTVWRIEKHGRFAAYVFVSTSLTGIQPAVAEGDWLYFDGAQFSGVNNGLFRVVRVQNEGDGNSESGGRKLIIWVENPNAIEEQRSMSSATGDTFLVVGNGSVVPGQKFVVASSVLGPNNVGQWNIVGFDFTGAAGTRLIVEGMSPATAMLDRNTGVGLSFVEGEPARFIKRIRTIVPVNEDLSEVVFDTAAGWDVMSGNAGTMLQALDKLAFDTQVHKGLDGYAATVGLIGEVSRVIYGDERDPITYPGVAAAGHSVNITGPLLKRVTLSFQIRLVNGINARDIVNAVKSAVAAEVNRRGVGEHIAISDLVRAASGVSGVMAVTVLSPTYSVGNDLIVVQPHEKPMILNVENDVTIKIVGA